MDSLLRFLAATEDFVTMHPENASPPANTIRGAVRLYKRGHDVPILIVPLTEFA
jgi:hypothetical protein